MSSRDRGSEGGRTIPRAVIHKKILDAAQSNPDASVAELTTAVNGASEGLVERVFDEYGDPAADGQAGEQTEQEENGGQSTMSTHKTNGATIAESDRTTHATEPESGELTEKQLEALHLIRAKPDATQRDLAERIDVTPSTINDRLNSIEGFEWECRQEFVESIFGDGNAPGREDDQVPTDVRELADQVHDLNERVRSLTEQFDGQSTSETPFSDPDLACKIVRACIRFDQITEDEENQILKAVITSTNTSE